MLVLGWHGNPRWRECDDVSGYAYHDAAAAITRDGEVIAAIEEERLNRVKHSNVFPARAIRFCLARARADLQSVDAIVTDISEDFHEFLAFRAIAADAAEPRQTGRQVITAAFQREFGLDVTSKLRFCKHHHAHLYGAWYPSGFSEALVVCLDGDGDGLSGLIAHCKANQLHILRNLPASDSLGNFYTALIGVLGYRRFDEYKVMGLAPYGDPDVHEELFRRLYALHSDGRFTLLPEVQRLALLREAGLAGKCRRRGEPFTQEHKDFAAALQRTLERIVLHIVGYFREKTRARHLCLSGGVAHNCAMNGVVARSGLFSDVFVQPAAHDAGNAIGAALEVTRAAGRPLSGALMPHVFLGTDIGTAEDIARILNQWRPLIEAELVGDPCDTAAGLLAQGQVIGWVQGRSEFGPRALGNRSILADPRPAENKQIINAMVKKREGYRPFAPAVIEERVQEYFEVTGGCSALPFMVTVLPVRPEVRSLLGAVTHVDGSARVQTVSRVHNPRFHALISAFGARSGVPIVLNTSFNNNAEPIVDSTEDAVITFLTAGIQSLLIGDWLVRKVSDVANDPAFLDLRLGLPLHRRLVRCTESDGTNRYLIQSASGPHLAAPSVGVSAELFHALLDDRRPSLGQRCSALGFDPPAIQQRLAAEAFTLWGARAIQMTP